MAPVEHAGNGDLAGSVLSRLRLSFLFMASSFPAHCGFVLADL